MRKLFALFVVLFVSGLSVFAQTSQDFGSISLDNGSFVYHGLKFEKLQFVQVLPHAGRTGDYDATAKDTAELSYSDSQFGSILVIKKKNGWVLEIPLRFVTFISYSERDKVINIF